MGRRTAVKLSKARKLKGIMHYCDSKGCKSKSVAKIYDIRDNSYHVCSRHKRILSARFSREAVNKLIRFYNNNCRRHPDAVYDACGQHYGYIDNLLNIRACLQKNDYVTAYAELHDLLYDQSQRQIRVYFPLMRLLYQQLSEKYPLLVARKKPLRPELVMNRDRLTDPEFLPEPMSRKTMIYEYNYVMQQCNTFLRTEPAIKRDIVKNALVNLEAVIELIRVDLKYDLFSVTTAGRVPDRMALIPCWYRDQHGRRQTTQVDQSNALYLHLNAGDSVFYSNPALVHSKGGTGNQVDYHRYLDVFHIQNSGKSAQKKTVRGADIIQSRCLYDDSGLFEHIRTNGSEWINVHTNRIVADVFDFRIAILYGLCRNKYFIERCGSDWKKTQAVLLRIFEQSL